MFELATNSSYPSSSYWDSTVVEFTSFFLNIYIYIYIPECQSSAILFSSCKLNLVTLSSLVTLKLHEMSDLYMGGTPIYGLGLIQWVR